MPLLKYFIVVGTVLTFGLFALSTYLEPVPAQAPGAAVGRADDGDASSR